ncbi:MAG: hypothetical protein ACE369_18645 [Roseovarius sp.]
MTALAWGLTTAMGLVFLIWAFEMFRMLLRISRHARDRTDESGGGAIDSVGHSLSAYGWFFTAPEPRAHRNRVIALTVLLMALVVARPLLLT